MSDWIFFSIRWRMATEPTTDPSYILQLPMAKAGVKALDTIENFLTSDEAPDEVRPHRLHSSKIFVQIQTLGLAPTHHIVTGASKRGWATWLVGAVDPRVMAIVPVVMDELNFLDNIKHHYRSLGGDIPLVQAFLISTFNMLCIRLVICAGVLLENEPHIVLQRPCAGDSL